MVRVSAIRARSLEKESDHNLLLMYRAELEEQRWTDIPKSVRRSLRDSGLIRVWFEGKGPNRVRIAIIYRRQK